MTELKLTNLFTPFAVTSWGLTNEKNVLTGRRSGTTTDEKASKRKERGQDREDREESTKTHQVAPNEQIDQFVPFLFS